MASTERRRAVRAPAKLAMQVKLEGIDLAHAETVNVSANGVYFSSKSHIPTLTRLRITLLLPSDNPKSPDRKVVCDGVVVRTEPDKPRSNQESYDIACYFTSISPRDQDLLEAYILRQLTF
jgi:hypothetical protein